MIIGPYEVLIANNRWLEAERLQDQRSRNWVTEKLNYLVLNPTSSALSCRAPINKYYRIRLPDNIRLYVRLFNEIKVIGVYALCAAGKIKKDEMSGSLDESFVHYLVANSFYSPNRFEPVPDLPAEETPAYYQKKKDSPSRFGPLVYSKSATQDEIEKLLKSTRRWKTDPFVDYLAGEIYRRSEWQERILVDAYSDGRAHEKEDVLRVMRLAPAYFKRLGLNYRIRFDKLSMKYMLVSATRMPVYDIRFRHIPSMPVLPAA